MLLRLDRAAEGETHWMMYVPRPTSRDNVVFQYGAGTMMLDNGV